MVVQQSAWIKKFVAAAFFYREHVWNLLI